MSNDRSRILHRQKFFALEPRIHSSLKIWKDLKKRLPSQLQARCNDNWRYLEPTQMTLDEVRYSLELEWIAQRRKPGRICCFWWWRIGDHRLLFRFNSFFSTACLMFLWRSSNHWWKILLHRIRKKKLEFEAWLNVDISGSGEWTSVVQFLHVQVVR